MTVYVRVCMCGMWGVWGCVGGWCVGVCGVTVYVGVYMWGVWVGGV